MYPSITHSSVMELLTRIADTSIDIDFAVAASCSTIATVAGTAREKSDERRFRSSRSFGKDRESYGGFCLLDTLVLICERCEDSIPDRCCTFAYGVMVGMD